MPDDQEPKKKNALQLLMAKLSEEEEDAILEALKAELVDPAAIKSLARGVVQEARHALIKGLLKKAVEGLD
jgi:hypothetical protein